MKYKASLIIWIILSFLAVPTLIFAAADNQKERVNINNEKKEDIANQSITLKKEIDELKTQNENIRNNISNEIDCLNNKISLTAKGKSEAVPLWIIALMGVIISAIALFKDDYKNWRYRPKLTAEFEKVRPLIEDIYFEDTGNLIRHFRLKIVNLGRRASEETEARVEKVVEIGNKVTWYHPTSLKWSGEFNWGTVTIPTKSHFFLDLFHINRGQNTWQLWVERPNSRGLPPYYVTKGDYELHLFITEKTTKPKKCIITVSWVNCPYLRPDVRVKWENKFLKSSEYVGFDDSEIDRTMSTASTTSGPINSQTTYTAP